MKYCAKCKELREETLFLTTSKGRLGSYCKDCRRVKARSYYEPKHGRSVLKGVAKPETWVCKHCKIEKPFTPEFFKTLTQSRWKLALYCKECAKVKRKDVATNHRRWATLEERKWLLKERASACCEVCGSTERLAIDHCHVKNVFRGFLCHLCNTALGAMHDDPALIKQLAAYADKHSTS